MSEQEQTPFFKVPVVPLCVDADLLALPPDTWVHIRNVSCADMGSGSCKAADAVAEIQRTMARQAKGNFTMTEVADVLAAANSFDAYRFLTIEMHPAALAGSLTLTNPEFGGPLVGRDSMEFHDWVTPANLDAWLERAGFPFRWPLNPEPQAATPAPVVGDSASNARVVPFKKAALIAAHVHEWPTIERDISDANANGLATAAKAGARGWREADALTWARAKGKLIRAAKPADSLTQAMHNLGALPSRKHTMQG